MPGSAGIAGRCSPGPALDSLRRRRTVPRSDATTILILGMLGMCLCATCGIVAWAKGNAYRDACRSLGAEPKGTAVAGRILGMIATCLLGVAILAALLKAVPGSDRCRLIYWKP